MGAATCASTKRAMSSLRDHKAMRSMMARLAACVRERQKPVFGLCKRESQAGARSGQRALVLDDARDKGHALETAECRIRCLELAVSPTMGRHKRSRCRGRALWCLRPGACKCLWVPVGCLSLFYRRRSRPSHRQHSSSLLIDQPSAISHFAQHAVYLCILIEPAIQRRRHLTGSRVKTRQRHVDYSSSTINNDVAQTDQRTNRWLSVL